MTFWGFARNLVTLFGPSIVVIASTGSTIATLHMMSWGWLR